MAERKEPTEPIPAGERRGSTEPLESAPGPDDARQRRLWLIAGILALILMFFVGFLVGREQGSAPAAQTQDLERLRGPRAACARALQVADRANRLLQRAVANRGAFTQATVGGDEETVSQLQKEFESVSNQYDRVEARLERLTDRCRGAT